MGTEAWSAFDIRPNISENNNPRIMILDTTFPANAQNQSTPVTQVLRSGMNLSDLTSPSDAVTALGATSSSTANALVRRNASGVFNASSINIDGAATPTLNIGAASIFTLGNATGNNQIFNGTVSGDVCIRQSDTARQLLIGVGTGNAQFGIQNTVILSNIAHRFTTVGANRLPFTDTSSNLTGSANYIVNGTGGLTITQGFTAATGTFSGVGGVVIGGTSPSANIGSTTQYGATTGNNQFFNPSLTNDTCIKNSSTSNFVRIGVGAADAQVIIGNTQVIIGVPIASSSVGANRMPFTNGSNQIVGSANYTVNGSGALTIAGLFTSLGANFTANANITATNQALTFDSTNQVSLGKASASNIFFTGTVSGDGAVKTANTSNTLHLGVGSAAAQQVIHNLEIDFSVGIRLPTAGGVAGLLSHFSQELTGGSSISFIITPDGTTHAATITYQRIGNIVVLTIASVVVSASVANTFGTGSGAIPALYIPAVTQLKVIPVISNGIDVYGCIRVSNLGQVDIGLGVDGDLPFASTGMAATGDITMVYLV